MNDTAALIRAAYDEMDRAARDERIRLVLEAHDRRQHDLEHCIGALLEELEGLQSVVVALRGTAASHYRAVRAAVIEGID